MAMMNDDNLLLAHDTVTAPIYYNEYIFKTKLHKFYVIANLILCNYSYIAEIGFIRLYLSSDQFYNHNNYTYYYKMHFNFKILAGHNSIPYLSCTCS